MDGAALPRALPGLRPGPHLFGRFAPKVPPREWREAPERTGSKGLSALGGVQGRSPIGAKLEPEGVSLEGSAARGLCEFAAEALTSLWCEWSRVGQDGVDQDVSCGAPGAPKGERPERLGVTLPRGGN